MISQQLKTDIQGILDRILKHNFNREVLDGTLCKKRFVFYLLQDRYYLKEYSRALAITAARLDSNEHIKTFLQFALEASDDEQALHTSYLCQYTTIIADLNVTEPSPSCFMYTNYLLQTAATKPVEQAIAALLPCFYVYQEVAKYMQKQTIHDFNHPYANWITLYASDDFQRSTTAAFAVLDALTKYSHDLVDIKKCFIKSTQLEWLFWESAYSMQHWAI